MKPHTDIYAGILSQLEAENRLRKIPPHRRDRELTDLCTNDYMGIARRANEWRQEFSHRFPDIAMSASASRLLASEQEIFYSLEAYLEDKYKKPTILFNSGYHANVGLVTSLNVAGTLWLADKLIHASVIDGLRMSHAEFLRWNHNDISHLRKILEREHNRHDRIIIVCESVYSMDGDIAPLKEIAALKDEFDNVMIYVDEAHAIGVFGHEGLGMCVDSGILEKTDILVGTLGKACGSSGAFSVTSDIMKAYITNTARSLIFSTAIAPVNAAWSLMMLEKLASMDGERANLKKISDIFRKGIEHITGTPNPSRSAIVPLMTGNASRAASVSENLEAHGILALPIRRPTVPPGGERIRFSLNATLTENQIKDIISIISATY